MREIKAHTGLRGIASLAVFLGHAEFDRLWPGVLWLSWLYRFFYWQDAAVDLFFMLSGFVLNYVYLKQRKIDWREYLQARFARICPLYYAGMFAVLAMNIAAARHGHAPSDNLRWGVFLRNLFLVQEWPVGAVVPSINIPSWSISVEVFLYLAIFPPLALLPKYHKPALPVFLALLGVALVLNSFAGVDNPFRLNLPYINLVRGISAFGAGFIICELVFDREAPLLPWPWEMALGLAAAAVLPFANLHLVLPFLFAGLIAVTYSPRSRLGTILGNPAFTYIGLLSYSVYIWHSPVIKACTLASGVRQMGNLAKNAGITFTQKIIYCCGTVLVLGIVSNISYFWFESPLRRLLRHSSRKPFPKPL